MNIGYTTGTFDLFHKGHVEFLKKAKYMCDTLIVGVTNDQLGFSEKGKYPVLPIQYRMAMLEACRYVDIVVEHNDPNGDKITPFKKYNYDTVFIGDDYLGDPIYNELPNILPDVRVIFLPYSKDISTTQIRNKIIADSKDETKQQQQS